MFATDMRGTRLAWTHRVLSLFPQRAPFRWQRRLSLWRGNSGRLPLLCCYSIPRRQTWITAALSDVLCGWAPGQHLSNTGETERGSDFCVWVLGAPGSVQPQLKSNKQASSADHDDVYLIWLAGMLEIQWWPLMKWLRCVVPVAEVESAVMAASGPRVQLGLRVRSPSSALGVNELKAGREAVDGLNKPLFRPPWKAPKSHDSLSRANRVTFHYLISSCVSIVDFIRLLLTVHQALMLTGQRLSCPVETTVITREKYLLH